MTKEVKDYIINQLQNFNIDINNVAFKNVNYIAVNSDGHVYGYKQKPRAAKYIWHSALSTFIPIQVPIPLVRNFKKEIISMEQFRRFTTQLKETNELIQSTMTENVKNYIIDTFIRENIKISPDCKFITVDQDGCIKWFIKKPGFDTELKCWVTYFKDFGYRFFLNKITDLPLHVPINLINDFSKEIIDACEIRKEIEKRLQYVNNGMSNEVLDYLLYIFDKNNIGLNTKINYIAVEKDGKVCGYINLPTASEKHGLWITFHTEEEIFEINTIQGKYSPIYIPSALFTDFSKEIISVEDFNKLLKEKKEKDNNMIAYGKVSNGIITSPIFENKDDIKNDDNPYVLNQLESLRPIFIEKQQINPYFACNFNDIYHTDNFYYKSRSARHQTENIIFSFEYNDIANDPKVITIPLSRHEYERWCNGLSLDSWLFDAHTIRQVFNLRKINNEYKYKNKGEE